MDEERGVGERGPDKEKREFNPKSLANLKQNQKPITSTNPTVNSGINWSKLGKFAIIAIVITAVFWKLYQRKKRSEEAEQN